MVLCKGGLCQIDKGNIDFRNFLREYKVFVPIDGGTIRDNIQGQVINIKEEYKWTL